MRVVQAIPKGELSVGGNQLALRACFLPSPGHHFLSADYEQIEFRVLAHLSGDPRLIRNKLGLKLCLFVFLCLK